MTLCSYGSAPADQTLYAHQEAAPIGSSYNSLKLVSSDQSGTTLSVSAKNSGRQLIGKFVYPLTGIVSIPVSSGTINYRAYRDSDIVGHCDANIVVRESDGTLRATILSTTAVSGNIGTSWSTVTGTYTTTAYTVVSQTDYLEIDCYMTVTTSHDNRRMYLQVDNSNLAINLQTSITNIKLPTTYTVQGLFTGSSASASTWTDLIWAIAASASTSDVTATFQLYNWGRRIPCRRRKRIQCRYNRHHRFINYTNNKCESFEFPQQQWILEINGYRNEIITTPFNLNLNMIKYSPDVPNYRLNMQEQWTDLNATYLNPHTVFASIWVALHPQDWRLMLGATEHGAHSQAL